MDADLNRMSFPQCVEKRVENLKRYVEKNWKILL